MFLNLKELKGLTHCKQKKTMIRWLEDNHYLFDVGADGWPVVMHSHVSARLNDRVEKSKRPRLILE